MAPPGKQIPAADIDRLARQGPGYPPLFRLPNIVTQPVQFPPDAERKSPVAEPGQPAQAPIDMLAVRIALVALHLAVVLGLVLIGYRHFDNAKTGIATAVLYLMLPYSAQLTGYLWHVLPAVPLVWTILFYRRPVLSGIMMGFAIGLTYYPVFLLPLWFSFYWQRGLLRFIGGLIPAIALLVGLLYLNAPNQQAFLTDLRQMFGWIIPQTHQENFEGFWGLKLLDPVYRIPILAAFVALVAAMTIWPAQKNLGTVMSCSAALMLGTEFWNAHQGGMFVGWYLAPLLLTIFRPNLEDRVAVAVVSEGWLARRRAKRRPIERASAPNGPATR